MEIEFDEMVEQYLVTGLWSTSGYDCENLDDKFGTSDISDEFSSEAFEDCEKLYNLIKHLLTEDENDLEQIGHDFWLTRNGHGAGFWDGDYVNGDAITAIVKANFSQNDDELREAINEEEAA